MTIAPGTVLHNPISHEWGRLLELDERRMVAELVTAPGGGVPLMHRHARFEERFEVLAGRLAVTIDGVPSLHGPGERAVIGVGRAHNWTSVGDEPLYARVTVTPPGRFVDVIAAAWGLCATGRATAQGAPRLFDAILLGAEYGEDMAPVSPPAAVQRLLASVVAPLIRATGRSVTDPTLHAAAIVDPARWPGPSGVREAALA